MKIDSIRELKQYITNIDILKGVIITLNGLSEERCKNISQKIRDAKEHRNGFCTLLIEAGDSEELLNRFINENYDLLILKVMIKLIRKHYDVDLIFEFVDLLKQYNLRIEVAQFITNESVLDNLSIKEMKVLISEWEKYNFDGVVSSYITNGSLLKNYIIEDIKTIIVALDKVEFNESACSFIDKTIKETVPTETMLDLLNLYVENNYYDSIRTLLLNLGVYNENKLSTNEITYLINKLKESNYDINLYQLYTNADFKHLSFEKKKKIMDQAEYLYFNKKAINVVSTILSLNPNTINDIVEYIIHAMECSCKVSFDKHIESIKTNEELDELLNIIEKDNSEADLNNDTNVYRYVYQVNNKKED